jgi:hypothetical protein
MSSSAACSSDNSGYLSGSYCNRLSPLFGFSTLTGIIEGVVFSPLCGVEIVLRTGSHEKGNSPALAIRPERPPLSLSHSGQGNNRRRIVTGFPRQCLVWICRDCLKTAQPQVRYSGAHQVENRDARSPSECNHVRRDSGFKRPRLYGSAAWR